MFNLRLRLFKWVFLFSEIVEFLVVFVVGVFMDDGINIYVF